MGLERICSVLQNVGSNFETDLFSELKHAISSNFKTPNEQSLNVVADHLRATFFLMSENVMPSNEGRGYVLRRIIRRAVRHGYKMDRKSPFLFECLDHLENLISKDFPNEFKNFSAAFCSAFFFDEPSPCTNLEPFSLTATVKLGLCLGPVLDISL